eukprot:gene12163-2219_t
MAPPWLTYLLFAVAVPAATAGDPFDSVALEDAGVEDHHTSATSGDTPAAPAVPNAPSSRDGHLAAHGTEPPTEPPAKPHEAPSTPSEGRQLTTAPVYRAQ